MNRCRPASKMQEEIRVIEARHQPRLGDSRDGAAASGIFVTSITFTATSTSSS